MNDWNVPTIAALVFGIVGAVTGITGAITGIRALQLSRLSHERQVEKDRQASESEQHEAEPLFTWRGGTGTSMHNPPSVQVTREFQNNGGEIRDLNITVRSPQGEIQSKITPSYVGEHGQGKIELQMKGVINLPEVEFEISYLTRLKRRSSQAFLWKPNGEPVRLAS